MTECFWEKAGTIDLVDITKDDMSELKMAVTVFDYDYTGNDTIGHTDFDLSKLVV